MQKGMALIATLEDYESAYVNSLDKLASAYRLIEQAGDILGEVSPHMMPGELAYRLPSFAAMRDDICARMWRKTFDATGLRQVMDSQARDEFDRTLDTSPPEYSVDNVQATYLELFNKLNNLCNSMVYSASLD